MKLYCLKRILRIEKSRRFLDAAEAAKSRKTVAAKVVEKKREETSGYVRLVEISVPKFSRDELLGLAIGHFNDRQDQLACEGRRFSTAASRESDRQFLLRITVNFLRHQMTDYEEHLDMVHGRVGVGEAYLGIKKKVLDAIAAEYPWLASECSRQWREIVEKKPGVEEASVNRDVDKGVLPC